MPRFMYIEYETVQESSPTHTFTRTKADYKLNDEHQQQLGI